MPSFTLGLFHLLAEVNGYVPTLVPIDWTEFNVNVAPQLATSEARDYEASAEDEPAAIVRQPCGRLGDQRLLRVRTRTDVPTGERIQGPRGQRQREVSDLLRRSPVVTCAEIMDRHRLRHRGLDDSGRHLEDPPPLVVPELADGIGVTEPGGLRCRVHGIRRGALRTGPRVEVDDPAGTTGRLGDG